MILQMCVFKNTIQTSLPEMNAMVNNEVGSSHVKGCETIMTRKLYLSKSYNYCEKKI